MRRRMGVKAGVPDWFVICPPDVRLAIELKKPEAAGKAYASKEEREWLAFLESSGFEVHVCRGFYEARAVVVRALKEHGIEAGDDQDCPF